MELQGKIIAVLAPRTWGKGKNTGMEQSYVLETEDEKNRQTCLFDVNGEEKNRELHLDVGDTVKINFDLTAKAYKDTWFGHNKAWKVDVITRHTD